MKCIFKVLKKKIYQTKSLHPEKSVKEKKCHKPKILCPVKRNFNNVGKIKPLPDKR